jgi:hypothetical protein
MSARWWITLAAILALAAALRIVRAGSGSLSFDEQWHLELSTGRGSPHVRLPDDVLIEQAPAVTSLKDAPPFWKVWTNMDFVVHPPLYCTLLRIWRDLFGRTDLPAQLFSITCSLLAISLLFDALRLQTGPAVAACAALILAIAPTQVLLAQQVRGYMLLEALAMGACAAGVRLEKHGFSRRRIIAFAACVLGMMLTHYLAVGACVALLAYLCIRTRGRARAAAILACISAAAVYAIIWGPFLWQQRANFSGTADPWLVEKSGNHFALTLSRAVGAPWLQLVQSPSGMLSIVVLIVILLAAVRLRGRRELLLWYLWLAGTTGLLLALDLVRSTRHLEFVRYNSLSAPAIAALIAAALWPAASAWWWSLPAAAVIVCAAMSSNAYLSEEPVDWRDLGRVIDQNSPPDEAIIFFAGAQPSWYREIFYLGAAHYSHAFPRPIVKLSHRASTRLIQSLPGNSVMLVSGQIDRPEQVLPGCRVIDQQVIPNLAICTRMQLPEKSEGSQK